MTLLWMLALAAGTPATPPDSAIGLWRTETRGGIVEIQRCGASICGRLMTSENLRTNPALKDINNRDAAQRGRPLKNLLMLDGFTADGAAWSGGRIYNAEDGRTYGAKVTPIDADHLKVRGCVVFPLCKSQTWTRVH